VTTEKDKVWTCEFCGHHNVIIVDDEEIPKEEIVDFIIEAPSKVEQQEDNMVIFCIGK
jgi:hypothetical protein